jgi:hypothetical protein
MARKDILGAMPVQVAASLRPILQDRIVTPAIAEHPFLETSLTVL